MKDVYSNSKKNRRVEDTKSGLMLAVVVFFVIGVLYFGLNI